MPVDRVQNVPARLVINGLLDAWLVVKPRMQLALPIGKSRRIGQGFAKRIAAYIIFGQSTSNF
jgi:hypothetical protein